MAPTAAPPDDSFAKCRSEVWKNINAMGNIPSALLAFVPRLALSFFVVGCAHIARAFARLFGTCSTYEKKANLRILIITDYMPPQTHGIAIRFRQYIDFMRAAGHEVQVFCTDSVKARESSFDHPNMPSIVNPYNVHNRMAYNPGVKLAWYLAAKQWDIVHLVYPSNISWAVLPVCHARRIPVYASHHVDMEYYIAQYVTFSPVAKFGEAMYWFMTKFPAWSFATTNAAPTLAFLKGHMAGYPPEKMARIPTGVADARFKVDDAAQVKREREALLSQCGLQGSSDACILIMVQRLAPEKDTAHALEALLKLAEEGEGSRAGGKISLDGARPVHLVVAGDGPSKKALEAYAQKHVLPVTFLGNLPNDRLPPLYRAADCFVTCSTSETYGLTVLEALACGTPAVLPHCAVFDELWEGKIPPGWIYDPSASDRGSLLASMRCAGCAAAKGTLASAPIKASWADATAELLRHYSEAIERNLPNRVELASYTRTFNQLLRAVLVSVVAAWLLSSYTKHVLRLVALALDGLIELLNMEE